MICSYNYRTDQPETTGQDWPYSVSCRSCGTTVGECGNHELRRTRPSVKLWRAQGFSRWVPIDICRSTTGNPNLGFAISISLSASTRCGCSAAAPL